MGRVCAVVSAVKCVNLAIHRPVPLGLIIHYMLIKIKEEEDYYKSNAMVFSKECIIRHILLK